MDFHQTLAHLTDYSLAITVEQAVETVPTSPGLYAIHVVDADRLPSQLRTHQGKFARSPHVIYVGQAKGAAGLRQRLVEQDLRQGSPSTFFRGMGSVLGKLPPLGSLADKQNKRNDWFSSSDAVEIERWMRRHLRVQFLEVSAGDPAISSIEKRLISYLSPCMNSRHNPTPCKYLTEQRRRSEEVACAR